EGRRVMTERHEELAALQALHMLEAEESRVFAGEIKYSPRSTEFIEELADIVGEFGLLVPPEEPPSDVRAAVLDAVKNKPSSAQITRKKSQLKWTFAVVGWAAAACLAIAAFGLWKHERYAVGKLAQFQREHDSAVSEAAR